MLERFDLEGDTVAMFEIDAELLYATALNAKGGYSPLSRFPESERDLALIVDADVPSTKVQSIIERHKLVKSSTPFDIYTGGGIPTDKKSVAYRIVFQSSKATLTTELVDRAQGDILRQLQREVGAALRG